ncbi:MAG: DUF4199 domain-containing protein [Bacteroidota bacterium]
MKKMWIIGLKSGIITVLGLMAYGLLVMSLGLQPSQGGGLEYVVLALGIYSGHYYYKAANNGLMTYPQGLKLGLIITSFTGLVNGLIIYLYTQRADPAWIGNLTKNVQKGLQQKGIGAPMIEEVGQWMQHLTPALLGIGTFASTVLLGFALALVVTAFSKSLKKVPSQE